LGIYAANSLGENIPLIIPENGTIALNIPLTPSRRGACSTRTTHPFFLDKVRHVLTKLEVNNPIRNPFQLLTKGECLERCKNLELLKELSLLSVSCGKRGHVREWKRRNANGCGRCIPCIFRRAALHKINYDIESYGLDFCAGEVDIDNTKKAGNNDIRACISFLNNNYSKKDIKDLLSSSGGLKVNELDIYSEVVYKAMKEVKELVKNKAIDDIKDRIVYLND